MPRISAGAETASSLPTTTSVGQRMSGSEAVTSGRSAKPRDAAAMPRGSVASITRRTFSSRSDAAVGLSRQASAAALFPPAARALAEHAVGHYQSGGGRFRRIGHCPRVAEDQCPQAVGVPPPKLKGDVAAHRQSTEHDRLADLQNVQEGGQVVGEVGHGDLVVRFVSAAAKAAEVGSDNAALGKKALRSVPPTSCGPAESHAPATAARRCRDRRTRVWFPGRKVVSCRLPAAAPRQPDAPATDVTHVPSPALRVSVVWGPLILRVSF